MTAVRVARKRLDVDLPALRYGLRACLRPPDRAGTERRLAATWSPPDAVVACLSARSGLDLLLAAVDWPAGSEVLLSALSIPHLPLLVRSHGYVPVAVDVHPATLQLDPDAVRRAITPRTRALLHAQLLGASDDLADVAAVAGRHGLLLVEDRAQAYDGRDRALGLHADVVLHSFGTIKTLTCCGGGVLLVRDPVLRARMRAAQGGWPTQPTRSYAAKLVRGALMLALAHPRVYPHFVRLAARVAGDHDVLVRRLSRGYADDDLLGQLRHRPSTALLALLAHRLEHDDPVRVQRRARAGERLADALDPHVRRLGARASRRTHWLFPVVADDPEGLVLAGRAAGFDLTRGSSTLVALDPACARAQAAMAGVVYLPAYPEMGDAALDRLAAVVNAASRPVAGARDREAAREEAAQAGRSSTAAVPSAAVTLPVQPRPAKVSVGSEPSAPAVTVKPAAGSARRR
ncbi:DegT/DnrJ/EryC1/StrS aminotransferase family protein [Friedmanniella luteola]|uniref:DegT/DnrJ/EryC1/StrS aminotransferase family protein n=1 Tax=Friedmanniella luteola TaxID=546871 RepID=A0A1H1YLH1_9ACTN|nr:DegT/DnrJ/EryC1/StrS family aminotransferase [Friedmanniella luteola]SDT22129.1 DegT/DnrJ/EryC1/StrS aminotransferase family protein [Friedmanniella luteola]